MTFKDYAIGLVDRPVRISPHFCIRQMKRLVCTARQQSFSQLAVDQRCIFGWQNSTQARFTFSNVRVNSFPFCEPYGPLAEKTNLGFAKMLSHSYSGFVLPPTFAQKVQIDAKRSHSHRGFSPVVTRRLRTVQPFQRFRLQTVKTVKRHRIPACHRAKATV
jgi:hypothetical protein